MKAVATTIQPRPKREVQSTYVYHCAETNASAVIDGHLIVIPPNELFEVEELRGTDVNNNGKYEYVIPVKDVIKHLMHHCWHYGLVVVPMTRTEGGVTSDIKAAQAAAVVARNAAEETMLAKYISDQQERVTIQGKSPLAPSVPIVRILESRGLDLDKDFNLKVPGLSIKKATDRDAEIAELQASNKKLQESMAAMLDLMEKQQKK